jgi:YfiH family protein
VTTFRIHDHPLLADPRFRHGWTDGQGPDFKTDPAGCDHARATAQLARGVGLARVAWARQVHGPTVREATGPGLIGDADALWTAVPGLGVIGRSADCPLVLVAGPGGDGRPLAGFAHASWRSTLQGITGSLVGALKKQGAAPAALRAVICPSAGPCCYEVGEEVRAAFTGGLGPSADAFFIAGPGKPHLDLWRANRCQLEAAGIAGDRIALAGVCTICGTGYPSYRREGARAGRFAAVIGAAVP